MLHFAYWRFVSPGYEGTGFAYREPDLLRYGLCIGIVLVLGLTLPRRLEAPSSFVLWVLFIAAGAPSILVSQYADITSPDRALVTSLHVASAIIVARVLLLYRPRRPRVHVQMAAPRFFAALGLFSAAVYGYLMFRGVLTLRYLPLFDVYGAREKFSSVTAGDPIIGYLVPVLFYVVNPLLIGLGVHTRRWWALGAGILGQALLYSSIGYKTILFSIPVVVGVALLFRRDRSSAALTLLATVTVGSIGMMVTDLVAGGSTLTTLFVRRFMIVPGALTHAYVDVFAGKPHTYFSEVLGFGPDAYPVNPTRIVGQQFVGDTETSANVSLFGHGFLSAGYTGIYIEALVLAAVLLLMDWCSKGIPLGVACAMFVMPAAAMAESSIFTAILTHGTAAAIVLAMLYPRALATRRAHSPPPGDPLGARFRRTRN